MPLKIVTDYSEVDKQKWGEFVYNHPNGNVFQTPEMYEVYQNTKNYEPVFLAVLGENDEILGHLVSFIRKEVQPGNKNIMKFIRKFQYDRIKIKVLKK